MPASSAYPAPIPETDSLADYLASTELVDWRTPEIDSLAHELTADSISDLEKASKLFEWVRDEIPHSGDARHELVTCRASDVLRHRTGLCFAKSHLLAALLRAVGVPAGFCYQRICCGSHPTDRMMAHGLNGIYLQSVGRWIRVDPRGNKPGVDAQFSVDRQQLAFPVRPNLGETLGPTVFVKPLPAIMQCFASHATVSEVLDNLPDSLET
jgi:transglutaminase-like putative cysteine protease